VAHRVRFQVHATDAVANDKRVLEKTFSRVFGNVWKNMIQFAELSLILQELLRLEFGWMSDDI
jgi:hypothetical protein